jgi:hypothetical protein
MRVKLQLVLCHDEGHEETVTDVITLYHRWPDRFALDHQSKQIPQSLRQNSR